MQVQVCLSRFRFDFQGPDGCDTNPVPGRAPDVTRAYGGDCLDPIGSERARESSL